MGEGIQLSLFSWDRVKVGEGFSALASLDLRKATFIFEDILTKWPGHPDASAGLQMAVAWDAHLREVENLHNSDAAASLWERIRSYFFAPGGQELKRALLRRAVALMKGDCQLYVPPDFCLGRLFFELEYYPEAERAIRRLLERYARDGRVLVLLGNSLFRQDRKSEARLAYAKAFLVAPWEVELEQIDDKELLEATADEDVYSAAICGWLRGVLPLIDVDIGSPRDSKHESSCLVYHTVRRAEQARAKGAHEEMVEQRRLLKQLAPAVFVEYMGRM